MSEEEYAAWLLRERTHEDQQFSHNFILGSSFVRPKSLQFQRTHSSPSARQSRMNTDSTLNSARSQQSTLTLPALPEPRSPVSPVKESKDFKVEKAKSPLLNEHIDVVSELPKPAPPIKSVIAASANKLRVSAMDDSVADGSAPVSPRGVSSKLVEPSPEPKAAPPTPSSPAKPTTPLPIAVEVHTPHFDSPRKSLPCVPPLSATPAPAAPTAAPVSKQTAPSTPITSPSSAPAVPQTREASTSEAARKVAMEEMINTQMQTMKLMFAAQGMSPDEVDSLMKQKHQAADNNKGAKTEAPIEKPAKPTKQSSQGSAATTITMSRSMDVQDKIGVPRTVLKPHATEAPVSPHTSHYTTYTIIYTTILNLSLYPIYSRSLLWLGQSGASRRRCVAQEERLLWRLVLNRAFTV